MKKAYQKPQIYAESFELVEHISSCGPMGHANHQDAYTCSFDFDGQKIFVNGKSATCTYNPTGEDDKILIEGIQLQCEYSFVDNGTAFSS